MKIHATEDDIREHHPVKLLCGPLATPDETGRYALVTRALMLGKGLDMPDVVVRDFVSIQEFVDGADHPTCKRCGEKMSAALDRHWGP